MINFEIKTQGDYPKQDQIDFIQLSLNRSNELMSLVEDNALSERERFLLLKELVSIYSEMERYPPIIDLLKTVPAGNPVGDFGPLFKVIRHLLSHFPFFDTWDVFWFNQEMVNAMSSPGKTIQNYFSKGNHPEFFFKFQSSSGELMHEGKIVSPKGYLQNQKIYLKDILSFNDAISMINGYCNLVLSSIIDGKSLTFFK